jgi:hypothetical protein
MGWFIRMIQVATVTLTLVAVCQELEKPKEERKWQGTVVGVCPYNFHMPTVDRIKDAYWNPDDSRIFTPPVFGIGWAINFCSLLENMRILEADVSEESFLMPSPAMKEAMKGLLPVPKELD